MKHQGKAQLDAQYGMLTTIATEAGVSLSTVSKVVHRRHDVSSSTRDRVEELLAHYGYVRPWDRDPATPRQMVAVFRDLSGPYTLEVVRGIVDAAGLIGMQVVTGTTSMRPISHWLRECVNVGALGLIVVISMLTEEDQRHIVEHELPVVLVDPLSTPSRDIPTIGVTNWSGAKEAVQHLLSLGHTRVGMIAGRSHSPAGSARLHGYRAALEEAGIAYDPHIVRSTDFDYDEGLSAALHVLRTPDRPTALFAASDAQAMVVLEAAQKTVLLVVSGRPYAIGRHAERATASVQAFFPSREGAGAVAGVLSGRVAPSGRLPVQIPGDRASQPGTYLAPPLALKSDGVSNIDPTPAYPFGHGLTYTTFEIKDVKADAPAIPIDGSVTVTATVANTGSRPGTAVPQLYLTDPVASVTRPVRRLIGFARIDLEAGERAVVEFEVDADLAGFTGRDLLRRVEPGRLVFAVAQSAGDSGRAVEVTLYGAVRAIGHTRTMTTPATVTRTPEGATES